MKILLPLRHPQLAPITARIDDGGARYRRLVSRTVGILQDHAADFSVMLLCPAEEQEAWGELPNVQWLDDPHGGNIARGVAWAMGQMQPPLVVLRPDLPLLSAEDLSALLKATGDVVWIPDRMGRGTHGMIWRAGPRPYVAFGRNDAMRIHLAACRGPRLYRRGFAWGADQDRAEDSTT